MKAVKLIISLLFFPLTFFAQTLTGLWTGTLSNDSTTIRKDQSFEIALTQYKNKVYGYSRSTFIVNDTLYYIIKRVKGTIVDDVCEVKDDDIIAHNFPGRPDKGVKMISVFRLNHQDSIWQMDGEWKTNKTKKYYSISGNVDLKSETNYEKSKLFPHLEELNLANDIAFYKESKKTPEPAVITKQPEIKKETAIIPEKRNPQKSEAAIVPKPVEQKKEVVSQPINAEVKKQPLIITPGVKPSVTAAALVSERKTVAPQVLNFKSDSLQLSLYDNGEVDGDTVSVLLNGEIIIAKQGLKTSAIKKTIYMPAGKGDSLTLVLYAENLGKYPPNTGLLIVHDGEDVYQIRFSADLQQNAAVIFKRKKIQ